MSIQERKLRQQSQQRQLILDVSKEIALAEGWSGLTMRKISERIEYSLPVIYKYFAGKEDIVAQIAKEGFELLRSELLKVETRDRNFADVAVEMAQTYVRFAVSKRHFYQAMFEMEGVLNHHAGVLLEAEKLFDFVAELLTKAKEQKDVLVEDPVISTEILWSGLHGLASLILVDRINKGVKRYPQIVDRMVRGYIASWGV